MIQKYVFGTDEQIIPDSSVNGCWRTKRVHFIHHDVLRLQILGVGEYVQTEYTVLHYLEQEIMEATMDEWVGPQSESDFCLPAEECRFKESFTPKFGRDVMWNEFTWGFTLTIEE